MSFKYHKIISKFIPNEIKIGLLLVTTSEQKQDSILPEPLRAVRSTSGTFLMVWMLTVPQEPLTPS